MFGYDRLKTNTMENLTQAEKDLLKIWESVPLPFELKNEVAPTIDSIRDKINPSNT